MADPTVEVVQGKLKGRIRKTIKNVEFYGFKGIPYAKPPIGNLRFSLPMPPEPWEGVRDATKDSSACTQYSETFDIFIGTEDCLHLNVFTPKLPTAGEALLPVMVYIHGGGFTFGHGTDDCNNGPEYLIEKNVVVVAINYRLGILGFLSLNCKDAPGNMGLRDQVQALKWVQANISKFNGDPNNVTIFGPSAGGASVEYLMLSPMAAGLFHKAIAQCGSTLCHWAQYSKVKELAYKIPALNNEVITNDEELLKYLKSLDVKKLVVSAVTVAAADEFRGGIHFGFVPVIEQPGDWEPFIDKPTYELLKTGTFTKVPFMAGFATREGLLMFIMGKETIEKVANEKNFVQSLPFKLDNAQENEIEGKLKDIYLNANNIYNEDDVSAIDFFTDVLIIGGVYTATSLIAKHSDQPVYFYEFSYDGNLNQVKKNFKLDRQGSCHGDEVGYLLRMSTLTDPLTLNDVVIRERMVTLWTNFAKFGDPTPTIDKLLTVKWEPVTSSNKLNCYVIDNKLEMKYEVYPERLNFYKGLYEKYPSSNVS